MYRCAVLLATKNGSQFIKEQIESIIAQRNVEINLFVCDDQSSDDTVQIIKNNFTKKYHFIELKKTKSSAALNFFNLIIKTNFSNFDYIALSDQDDIWHQRKINRAIECLTKSNSDCYSSSVTAYWSDGKKKLLKKNGKLSKYNYFFESPGPGCTFVFRVDVANALKKLIIANESELYEVDFHDWFIYAWACSQGYSWYIDEQSLIYYRQHTKNVFGANVGYSQIIRRWKLLTDGWYVKQILTISRILGLENNDLVIKIDRLHFSDRVYLALRAYFFRRRFRDKFMLALAFLVMKNTKQ